MKINQKCRQVADLFLCTFLMCFLSVIPTSAASESGDEEEHEEGHVELSIAQIEHAGIGLAKVQAGSLQQVLSVYGTVRSNPEGIQRVSAPFEGVVLKVEKRIGDIVKRGEVLLSIEANESMQSYPLLSSIDGVVTRREANIGEQTSGRALLVIEDLSSVWIELSLFPKDVRQVQVGQKVRISSLSRENSAEGELSYIAAGGNSSNQTVLARVPLENTQRQWIPEQFVVGEIILSEARVPLLVRNEALQIVENNPVIFVKSEEGFEPRSLQLGRSDGQSTEVLAGLVEGETYVTKNSFVLKSELGKEDAEHGH